MNKKFTKIYIELKKLSIMEGSNYDEVEITTHKKKVSFMKNAKNHDGLNPSSKLFERYIVKCVNNDKHNYLLTFLQEISLNEIKLLKIMLIDLINRCKSSDSKKIPLLSGGGGKGYTFKSEHFGFFNGHLQYLQKIIINKKSQEQ